MDTLTYQNAIKQVIEKYAQLRPSHGEIELETVFDEQRHRYALMQVGWDKGRRVRGNLIYIKLEQNKVHIEYDGLEHGIGDDLIAEGVAPADIVWAFLQEPSISQAA
jgi:hypothetical protein